MKNLIAIFFLVIFALGCWAAVGHAEDWAQAFDATTDQEVFNGSPCDQQDVHTCEQIAEILITENNDSEFFNLLGKVIDSCSICNPDFACEVIEKNENWDEFAGNVWKKLLSFECQNKQLTEQLKLNKKEEPTGETNTYNPFDPIEREDILPVRQWNP